ncbi:hypothetical protein BH11PAT1_BH11PAT1_1650 [soil metagenome]
MPTLNKTTNATKSVLKWLGIIIGSIFLLIMLFRMGRGIKEYFWPTPPPPPTVSFGKLPAIVFPDAPIKETFTYALETVTGNFPYFPDRGTVFQILPVSPNLLNADRAKEKVIAVGFVNENNDPLPEKKIGPTTYQWEDSSSLHRILTMDIDSFNFTLTSSYLTSEEVLARSNLPQETKAIATAQNFVNELGLFATDIDPVKTTSTLLTLKDGSVSPATSFSTANLIKVNFFQKDANSLSIVYPYPPYSLISLLVASSSQEGGQIVDAKYVHRNVTSSSATYPIKTASLAYDELQKGKAYIASFNGSGKDIIIRTISLAYFIGDGQQNFLLPVIVFEGDDNFLAYVSAVSDSWISK